jgi:hypothetical protein
MDAGWMQRMRWRRRGAWLWPVFAVVTLADGAIGSALPLSGDSQSPVGAALLACCLNLVGVVLLSRPLAMLIRRRRGDLPLLVAHNYAGTAVVLAIAIVLLLAGVAHRPSIQAHQRALRDALVRAEAWIGDRAPAQFRRNVRLVSAFAIEPGSVYRACVPSDDGRRTYCVIVRTQLPLMRSVSFDGYEPNSVFAQGAG